MVFTQKFESSSQNLNISVFKNLIFQPSEARLSSITQNWNKSLSFHDCVPKGLTNFECPIWKLHTLNYHTLECSPSNGERPRGCSSSPRAIYSLFHISINPQSKSFYFSATTQNIETFNIPLKSPIKWLPKMQKFFFFEFSTFVRF